MVKMANYAPQMEHGFVYYALMGLPTRQPPRTRFTTERIDLWKAMINAIRGDPWTRQLRAR